MLPSSPSADYISGATLRLCFGRAVFCYSHSRRTGGARLRISGGCPARGEPEALFDLCSSIACRAQPCQRCSPVLQALIISQYAFLRLCFGRAVFLFLATPSVTCGDSSPKGAPLGNAAELPSTAEAVPLGKVASRSDDGRGNLSREKGVQESPQTFLYPKIQITFPLFMRIAMRSAFQIVPPCGSAYFFSRSFSR